MQSCIYSGWVNHVRHFPQPHRFRYRLFQMFLDLDELPTLFDKHWFWSVEKFNLASFRKSDHLGDPQESLSESVRTLVEQEIGTRPAGPIRLLTNLRYWGYGINPVSFYYCYSANGECVEQIVAEVHNTPWGEEHSYVLVPDWGEDDPSTDSSNSHFEHPKTFHVSPFLNMDYRYSWTLSPPGESLKVHVRNLSENQCHFEAALSLKRRPISTWNLSRTLVSHPLMTGKIVSAIYWQALRLWWKGIPFVPHPDQQSTQKRTSDL